MAVTYSSTGVKSADEMPGFHALLRHLGPTFDYPNKENRPVIEFGYYANVIPVAPGLGIAISTDGVGTKILVAEALGIFDTIGIDCVAMNVNDVICVGAKPVSMVDYIAVESPTDHLLEQLGIGFAEGARQAGISIPGGELAQIPDLIKGHSPGQGFDLVGTCIGTVSLERVLTGKRLQPGDRIIGLESSGIHSNGLTMARKCLGDLDKHVPELGWSVGQELLKPTRIYVEFANRLLACGVDVKALAHITSDGFLNLTRVDANVSFEIERLPEIPPVFDLIQHRSGAADAEMFRVFNMGIGFVAVVSQSDIERTLAVAHETDCRAHELGTVTAEAGKKVYIHPRKLVGQRDRFYPV